VFSLPTLYESRGFFILSKKLQCRREILFGNRITILAPGKHCDVVWHCQSNCSDHVPEVPEVPHVPIVSEFVWQQRITLVTFLYKLVTLPNNIIDPITGITSVKSFNKTLTKQFV
jgi:hypothetical protein